MGRFLSMGCIWFFVLIVLGGMGIFLAPVVGVFIGLFFVCALIWVPKGKHHARH